MEIAFLNSAYSKKQKRDSYYLKPCFFYLKFIPSTFCNALYPGTVVQHGGRSFRSGASIVFALNESVIVWQK